MRDAHKLMMKFLNTLAVMTEHVKYTSSGDANILWAVQNSPNYFRLSFSFEDAIKNSRVLLWSFNKSFCFQNISM